jgi:hypothetical protein
MTCNGKLRSGLAGRRGGVCFVNIGPSSCGTMGQARLVVEA